MHQNGPKARRIKASTQQPLNHFVSLKRAHTDTKRGFV